MHLERMESRRAEANTSNRLCIWWGLFCWSLFRLCMSRYTCLNGNKTHGLAKTVFDDTEETLIDETTNRYARSDSTNYIYRLICRSRSISSFLPRFHWVCYHHQLLLRKMIYRRTRHYHHRSCSPHLDWLNWILWLPTSVKIRSSS